MQVILRERMDNLGDAGEVVSVKPGYARNYLIPKGLAFEANDANLRRMEREAAQREKREADRFQAAREQATALEGVSITFTMRAGEEGRLFGSIGTADIAEKLAEVGIEVDRKQVQLEEPIKALGVVSVPIRLHTAVEPEIKVWVIKEE